MGLETIIGLVAGAVGGNASGAVFPGINKGTLINSIAGIVGGGAGSTVLGMLGAGGMAAGGLDLVGIIGQVAAGGIGGGGLLAIVSVVMKALGK